MTNMNPNKKKEIVIEPVIPEEAEWSYDNNIQLCNICQQKADKKITIYGNPDGLLRILRYCDYCIIHEVPQFLRSA